MKELSQARLQALEASKSFQEFSCEINDLKTWLGEKMKTACDENYKEFTNLERKLQKHEAFERELKANEGQLSMVNKLGQSLIADDNYRKEDIARLLEELNADWRKLMAVSQQKGHALRQVIAQREYSRALDDVHVKLQEIDSALKNKEVGSDLRSCRELINKHEQLENSLTVCKTRCDELILQGEDIVDSTFINNQTLEINNKLQLLEAPIVSRKNELNEALKYHKFAFEVLMELQWISERLSLALAPVAAQNLHIVQAQYKKHKKLEAEILGHFPVIDKIIQAAQVQFHENCSEKEKVRILTFS